MGYEIRRLLLLGVGIAALLVGAAFALGALAGFGEWRMNAYLALTLAMFVSVVAAIRPGSWMAGASDPREVYVIGMARSVTRDGLGDIGPRPTRLMWLWPLLPLFIALLLVSFSA